MANRRRRRELEPHHLFLDADAGRPAADLHDPQTLYTSSGYDPLVGVGLYKTTNGGGNWTPVEAPGKPLPGARVKDLAVDPGDPNVAYLLSNRGGVFKTTNATTTDPQGPSWLSSNGGIADPFSLQSATKIVVDPLARNNVYVGRIGLWHSPDAGGSWTDIVRANLGAVEAANFALSPLGIDKTTASKPRGLVFLASEPPSAPQDDPVSDFELVGGTLRALNDAISGYDTDGKHTYQVQVASDPGRTVIKSWALPSPIAGFVQALSLAAAERSSGSPVRGTTIVANVSEEPMAPPNVIYDRSDGTNRLFAGGASFESHAVPGLLYRIPLEDALRTTTYASAEGWEPLTPGGPAGFSDFSRLIIDPASGGQTMYTIGAEQTLWQSDDGGRHWRRDSTVPAGLFVTNIWLSPVDGALFATLAPGSNPAESSSLFYTMGAAAWAKGLLWRRTLGALPPGARAVTGSLRPKCDVVLPASVPADDPRRLRAIGPGSTFPVDEDTTVVCTATDAFRNTDTKTFTIQVRDTTPPTLTLPAPMSATITSGTTATVVFSGVTALSAVDLVDGPITPSCTATRGTGTPRTVFPLGTAFQAGAWTVTCTATDAHGNNATASFPLTVSTSATPLVPPTLDLPTVPDTDASGPSGATISFDVTATGAAAAPTCKAPIGVDHAIVTLAPPVGSTYSATFPIGTTEVTCSASSGGASPLTAAESFTVTVKDGPPRFTTVPSDFGVTATKVSGFRVFFQAASSDAPGGVYPAAIDDVDGAIVPTCAPASGSVFPIGTTLVTCRASDHVGNRATASFNVTVTGMPPILHLPTGLPPIEAVDVLGAPFNYDALVSASDHAGPLPISCAPLSGQFPLGDTTVTCSASNAQGETQGTFVVSIVDTTLPVVSVPSSFTLEAAGPAGSPVTFTPSTPPASPRLTVTATDPGGHPLSFVVSAFDVTSGSLMPICRRETNTGDPETINPGPQQFSLGDDVVTCTATDAAGNPGSKSFTIVVRDTTPPTLHVPAPPPPPANADASGGATVSYDDPAKLYATDLVSGAVAVSCTPRSGSRFLVGTTTVACVARDAAGNEARDSFQVLVRDGTIGHPCTSGTQCGNGQCVDGVCCATTCGGGDPNDCQVCSIAAGGTVDGTCTPLSSAHVCRSKAGGCDVAETCDGTSPGCPTDAFATGGTTCRESAGVCDVAETCTGTGAACPADAKRPANTACTDDGNLCSKDVVRREQRDVPAHVAGSGGDSVPAGGGGRLRRRRDVQRDDDGVPGGRVPAGDDGVPSGAAGVRPGGELHGDERGVSGGREEAGEHGMHGRREPVLEGHLRREQRDVPAHVAGFGGDSVPAAAAGGCDVAETCSGTTTACPADGFLPATTVCRPAPQECDVAESCTGTSAACPADAKKPANTACTDDGNLCSRDICDGSNVTCQHTSPAPAGTVCRPAAPGGCDVAETCNGTTLVCPADGPACGDTTPPVWSNVPGTIIAYATGTAGAVVTYTKPTATDAVDGVRSVTCTPAPGTLFAPGKKTVTCTACDTHNNTATVTFTVWVQLQAPGDGTFFLQPINADGSSIFKLGSTIATKFKLQGASAGITNLVAKLTVAKVSSSVTGSSVEAVSTSAGDSGNTFRYDPVGKQYIFNLSTKGMSAGTWSLRADLGDLVDHTVKVSLK